MTFALRSDESVAAGLRRLAVERLDLCRARLRDPAAWGGLERAVHEARTDLKQLRALLRLSGAALGKTVAKRENAALRDAGRALAGPRDATVSVAALTALAPGATQAMDPAAFEAVRQHFVQARAAHDGADGAALRATMDAVARALDDVRSRAADSWRFEGRGFSIIRQGLKKTYKRGRRGFRAACEAPSAEALHEWRKRVKDLWYQLGVLEPAWPSVLESYSGDLKTLSDVLGDEHDQAMLKQGIHDGIDRGQLEASASTRAALDELIEARRGAWQDEALALGQRLYRDKPGVFVAQLGACFERWHASDLRR